jgi:hypothetical protein
LGFIENFERRLENFVNGAFSKAFKSQLQPVEITAAIKGKMDVSAAVIGKERILAANDYKVSLSQQDYLRLSSIGDSLLSEIKKQVSDHAKRQRYQLSNDLLVSLSISSSLSLGQIQVIASGSQAEQVAKVSWVPALDVGGKRYLLAKARTTIGRDNIADIQINDSGLSRTHFAISWDGTAATIEDLGSTNGTSVAGSNVSSQKLTPDTGIKAGRSEFIFRVVAKNQGSESK